MSVLDDPSVLYGDSLDSSSSVEGVEASSNGVADGACVSAAEGGVGM